MGFIRQTWTLCEKTLTLAVLRHWLGTAIRAFFAPIIFMFIIAYAKNFFVPPSEFGVGDPTPLRSLSDAVGMTAGGRNTFVFVDNGFTGGAIADVIGRVSEPMRQQGLTVRTVESDTDLLTICRSSIRGVTTCFGAVEFHSSPDEGDLPIWNYTMRADGAFGQRIFVNSDTNDAQIYALPLQHAIDNAIAAQNGSSLPDEIQQYAYTDSTPEERRRNINRLYMGSLIDILAVAYFIGIVGICYQLTGEMAKEREMGMSQLIEAMMPNRKRWTPQAARLLALHISFDILYFPSWVIMGAIVSGLNYSFSSAGIPIGYFIMSGLALSSWSIMFASSFRKAQLSGITVVITSIILAIIVQVQTPDSTGAVTALSLIFPPMNFTLFIIYMAYWQQEALPADLSSGPPGSPWSTPGYLFFIFCAIQIIVFPIVGAFLERALYGTASKARQLQYGDKDASETLKITGLSKHYPPGFFQRRIVSLFRKTPKAPVIAVDAIDVNVLRGQVMVLLGANGSGKTTTLDMLAGLQAPTNGTIEMDATGGIGLCPQKNVLWDELTVYEHVRIFNRLKSTSFDDKQTMKQLVNDCDLEQKTNAPTRTLSGGQKRKCQLAMMLTGGSSLCMLDEVSSGLDPLSRRKIWDIILAERGKRSMVLTTHFLDEADLLSDDITILSKGKLVAKGSAVALKHELGGGYRVRVYHENNKPLGDELDQVQKKVYHDQTVYHLTDSGAAAKFIAAIERAGVHDYQVNGPTIEDVFLKLASEVKEELEKDRAPSPASDSPVPAEKGLQLATGKTLSFVGQAWVLFRKRVTILRRNTWPYLAALFIPIIAGGLVTFFIMDFNALSCEPNAQVAAIDQAISLPLFILRGAEIPAGPPDSIPRQFFNLLLPQGLNGSLRDVTSREGLIDYIAANFSSAEPGGVWLGNQPLFNYRGNYDMSYAIASQNFLDVSLLNVPIVTGYTPFQRTFAPSAGDSLQFTLYFGLAMCIYPAFFALYTNLERLKNVRALHYSNGVRVGPLWLAYTLFDFIIVLLVSLIAIIIFTGVNDFWYGPGQLFVAFVFYGLAATLACYVVSLFTTSQLATFAFAAGGLCSMFLLYFVIYMVLITYSPAALVDRNVEIAHYTLGLFFPSGNLLRALLLTFNQFSLVCRDNELASFPGAWDVYGSGIAYSIFQSVAMAIVLVWYDSGYKPAFLTRRKHRDVDAEEETAEGVDAEVFTEAKRVDSSSDDLRVLHATKAFGSNVAVQDVTFGVPKGETFALLGPNGAGKSTTIGLIRGDMRPSDRSGEILVGDTSIISKRAAARQFLGVCPQFDAMDQMTAVEHLRFYARARGVPDVESNVKQVLHAVGLAQFQGRKAGKLSGGNKRKLSLGIALIGNPSVLLLDEPSSGMDAASKRVMWRTLSSVASGRSLVLTTHSMEEADALASRAGIMARRMLAVGTADELRKRHGDAYHVHLVHKDAPYTSTANMDKIKAFIKKLFPTATTEDRVFHGQLRFSVPNDRTARRGASVQDSKESKGGPGPSTNVTSDDSGISALFQHLEANKEILGFEYYSVSQATLDQVFLSIVGKHNVMEENYQREHAVKDTWVKKLSVALGGDGTKKSLLCGF